MERIVVTALGDSITAGSPGWDPDPDVRDRLGGALDERSQWEHWAAAADPRLVLRVVLADVLPWNNGWPDAEGSIRELNALIERVAAQEDAPLLPFHSTLEDTTAPGRMRDEWTSDGDHPSVEGYRRLGELAFRLP
jgi:lysophospholipase L1-like esterase